MAHLTHDRLGITRVSALVDMTNQSYTMGFFQGFRERLTQMGGEVVQRVDYLGGSGGQYGPPAQALLRGNPQALLIVAGSVDTAMIVQQLRKMGVRLPVLGCGWAMTSQLVEHGGQAVEGLYFVQNFNPASQAPAWRRFRHAFQERFGYEPGFAASQAHECAQIVIQALAQGARREDIKERVLAIKNFAGIQSSLSFDRFGDVVRPRWVVTVQDGQFVHQD